MSRQWDSRVMKSRPPNPSCGLVLTSRSCGLELARFAPRTRSAIARARSSISFDSFIANSGLLDSTLQVLAKVYEDVCRYKALFSCNQVAISQGGRYAIYLRVMFDVEVTKSKSHELDRCGQCVGVESHPMRRRPSYPSHDVLGSSAQIPGCRNEVIAHDHPSRGLVPRVAEPLGYRGLREPAGLRESLLRPALRLPLL